MNSLLDSLARLSLIEISRRINEMCDLEIRQLAQEMDECTRENCGWDHYVISQVFGKRVWLRAAFKAIKKAEA